MTDANEIARAMKQSAALIEVRSAEPPAHSPEHQRGPSICSKWPDPKLTPDAILYSP